MSMTATEANELRKCIEEDKSWKSYRISVNLKLGYQQKVDARSEKEAKDCAKILLKRKIKEFSNKSDTLHYEIKAHEITPEELEWRNGRVQLKSMTVKSQWKNKKINY